MKHLLLLHGALGHSKDFDAYEPVLSQHFTVHKILFTGHGGMDVPSEGISMQGYVNQVKAYCELHGIDGEIYLFGYSMGGYIVVPQKVCSPRPS